ncbi:hypothetical protein PHISCL_01880 [Aspergillus sclerotialis]|uniref:DUF7730 domain-containing protein n=1 Tax=Aspergillus sclerotialis TaxID=2070753 RepID=A0A3A2ZWJ4_9EURO|nr:hypothetical protein PHISCL_01880 [Aspergillus sclerotialis]
MSSNTRTTLTFFNLPVSVREKIYRYALVRKLVFIRPFVSMAYFQDSSRKFHTDGPILSLLSTSKQIYKEAMPIYLTENIFSIVHSDMLTAARLEYPRVFENLKLIRRLELIFDSRDYVYLRQFILDNLPNLRAEIEFTAPDSKHKRAALERLDEMCSDFDVDGIHDASQSPRHASVDEDQETHDRHIENMKDYLWGRTLTFVRQTFRLTHLYVDVRACTCVNGCCRLADEVMSWGWFYVWVHGLPDEIQVRGASKQEMDVIASTFDGQLFHEGLEKEEIYDLERAEDAHGFKQYNALLKSVRQGIIERNL